MKKMDSNTIRKINQAYSRDLRNRIENLRGLGDYDDNDIYDRLSRDYGLIVSVLSKKFPELRLSDIAPITKVFSDFEKEYLGE